MRFIILKPNMKNLLVILALISSPTLFAQMAKNGNSGGPSSFTSFIEYQKSLSRPADVMARKEDTLQKQFEKKGLKWPAKYVYIRSFKYDSQLEIWVKNEKKEPYKLFKTYKVCALAGTLGPKRMEGDYQVPEGFYYINEFNGKSTYHLSLGLNYPNASDRLLSDSVQPGGDIYIHGSCVTVGCIPLTDPMIEEVYIVAAHAKDEGEDFIPVHIYPIRFNVKKSVEYLDKLTKDDNNLKKFASKLEDAFNYFEKYKQLPLVMVGEKGEYIVYDAPPKNPILIAEQPVKKSAVQHRVRNITDLAGTVYVWPQFPGGGEAFLKYLDKLGKQMVDHLPASIKKVYAQVEFIVDKDGMPVNFKVLKGLTEDFNEQLITTLENTMQNWKPAMFNDKPVSKKMVQTITIESPFAESE